MMYFSSDNESLFVDHEKEYMKFAEIILHIIDSHEVLVRSDRYINKINLNTLK